MDALDILIRTLSAPVPMGPSKTPWQYHSRSDRHSKIACWGILFDLLQTSSLLRAHVADGKVSFGVNHTMRDFVHNKKKNLDLVLCRPEPSVAATPGKGTVTLQSQAPVGAVLTALEAKATMTEHVKAGPRLYDELNSSHQIVHASSNRALSVGFFMVNAASTFISPDRNKNLPPGHPLEITHHKQPAAAKHSIDVVKGLPRRSSTSDAGYDGLAIVAIDMPNDGVTPVRLVTEPPAPQQSDIFNYDTMLTRVANEYDAAFTRI